MSYVLPPTELFLRLIAAALLGGVLGFEREWRNKPAGLRTHMMVSLGAACFSLAALGLAHAADDGSGIDVDVQVDPMRIAEGVIGGIGFLGAGAILRNRETVEGLTTAGSIWLVGAVGLAAGSGHYVLASIAVGIAVAILMGVGWLESRWLQRADDCGPE